MSRYSIPAAGLKLQHDEHESKPSSQIIRIDVPKEQLAELIRSVKNGGDLRLKTGKSQRLLVGSKQIGLFNVPNRFPQETYSCPLNGATPAYFTGKFSHVLEVQQAKEATAGAEEALQKLKNTLKQSNESRGGTPEHSSNNKPFGSQHRSSALANVFSGSRPSSPFLGAALSPRLGPTSAPKLGGQSDAERIRQAAIRIPAIHLLASEPQNAEQLAKTLRVKKIELDQILSRVAEDSKHDRSKKELRDRAYRDLDVWKFPYSSQSDRQAAIDRAISAFDRLRIDKLESVWQMLLDKQDRGKGIHLGRLNLSGMQNTGRLIPRVGEKTTDSGSTEGKSLKSATSDSTNQKAPSSKSSKLSDKSVSEKPVKTAKKLNASKAIDKAAIPVLKHQINAPTQDRKYKSSEKIEDSDEEASATPSLSATKQQEKPRSSSERLEKHTVSTANKETSRKPHHPASSSSSTEQNPDRLDSSSKMVRTRAGKETTASSGKIAHSRANVEAAKPEAFESRMGSRARTGSSPNKPSPLGSSPPTNSRDVENSSVSSNSTSLSSAPSSPPVPLETAHAKTQRFSPVVANAKPPKPVNGVKRKAESTHDMPPGKKQQLTNGKTRAELTNGSGKAAEKEQKERPGVKRNHSDSSASSTSDVKRTKEELIEEAKGFHKYYAKYKALHDSLHALPDAERDDGELDKLWKWHVRLKDMKDGIWKEWGKLEKAEKL